MTFGQPLTVISGPDEGGALAQDFLVFGNAYLELRKNLRGGPLALKHVPAKYMQRGSNLDQY
ncbi:hypothetical protein [Yersinia pseudotuberculosis]|uniref:hypothetical protein n=1 Tax=Yersinia pseudotuberculosis TaxID=633 RepID=UPI0002D763DB|nr:hypothetical protein BLA52_15950 [Yersinia pseudotuberculosis]GAE10348.1 hypothetical protein YP1_005_00770 [Yersinia pseudotuberculosis NBRC 105692]PSH27189.1 hypothetical protein BLA50_05810 [Yersinia pseudotuberculosis]PSH32770.1 hypothetical protein BLA51_02635 [Yersinia pseudotuberculosis]PSH33784.1 hypothetical protein BA197_14560 [Yersinia pseudotuberculosis]